MMKPTRLQSLVSISLHRRCGVAARSARATAFILGALLVVTVHAAAAQPASLDALGAQPAAVDLTTVKPVVGSLVKAPPLLLPLPPGKSLHFIAGMAGGFLAAAAVEATHDPQLIGSYPLYLPSVAFSTATVAGIGKEVLDSTGFGGAEFSDILITMAGGLTAAAAVAYAEPLFPATPEGRTNSATLLAATGALLAVPVVIGLIHEIVRSAQRHAAARESLEGAKE